MPRLCRTLAHTLVTAATLAFAATPAHADPFGLVPVGATTLAAWAYTGISCASSWQPNTAAPFPEPVPAADVYCVRSAGAALYRGANGAHGFAFGVGLHSDYAGALSFQELTLMPFFSSYPNGPLGTGAFPTGWYTTGGAIDAAAAAVYVEAAAGRPLDLYSFVTYQIRDNPYQGHPDYGSAAMSVTLAPVPEPSTYVLVGSGALLVGVVARRRRSA
jgi:hypothetical protein